MVDGLMSKGLKAEARRPGSGAILVCERRNLPAGATRENDFALLSATGKPFSGNCGCRRKAILADNSSDCSGNFDDRARLSQEAVWISQWQWL
ncbi:hypothetical protein [Paraburkholderia xenovorans]|uniref:hypothetical protein n=1 Tax=Paraburkholderia xenovorans TaxID=36873 RepID=UPI0038BB0580